MLSDMLRQEGCEVNGDGDYVIKLESSFSNDYFCYETLAEALEALARLVDSSQKAFDNDNINREVSVVIGYPTDLA